jgi:hypothetical protein
MLLSTLVINIYIVEWLKVENYWRWINWKLKIFHSNNVTFYLQWFSTFDHFLLSVILRSVNFYVQSFYLQSFYVQSLRLVFRSVYVQSFYVRSRFQGTSTILERCPRTTFWIGKTCAFTTGLPHRYYIGSLDRRLWRHYYM